MVQKRCAPLLCRQRWLWRHGGLKWRGRQAAGGRPCERRRRRRWRQHTCRPQKRRGTHSHILSLPQMHGRPAAKAGEPREARGERCASLLPLGSAQPRAAPPSLAPQLTGSQRRSRSSQSLADAGRGFSALGEKPDGPATSAARTGVGRVDRKRARWIHHGTWRHGGAASVRSRRRLPIAAPHSPATVIIAIQRHSTRSRFEQQHQHASSAAAGRAPTTDAPPRHHAPAGASACCGFTTSISQAPGARVNRRRS